MKIEIDKKTLEKLYCKDKLTCYQIANILGVSETTVRRRLREYGIPIRRTSEAQLKVMKRPSREELEKLYIKLGMTLRQIAEIYGVDITTVHRWLRKYNIKRKDYEEMLFFNNSEVSIPVERYNPPEREDISISIPFKILGKKEKLDCTLTLVLSDLHLGHSDFLPETYLSTVKTLIKVLDKLNRLFNIRCFRIVLNGDIVSGREVYPMQELSNLLPRGHWQVFVAEMILKELFEEIEKIVKIDSVYLIKGTHESQAENYLLYLKRTLKENGYNVMYSSRSLVLNIADPIGKYNVFFSHGRGRSDYYPVSLSMIRDLWKVMSQYKMSKIPIERCCLAHTHWLSTNLELEGLTIDVTGGFQRWEKTHSQRPSGMILYFYTEGECCPIPIRPNRKVKAKEITDPALEYKNIKFYGEKLMKHVKEIEGVSNEEEESTGETSES